MKDLPIAPYYATSPENDSLLCQPALAFNISGSTAIESTEMSTEMPRET